MLLFQITPVYDMMFCQASPEISKLEFEPHADAVMWWPDADAVMWWPVAHLVCRSWHEQACNR